MYMACGHTQHTAGKDEDDLIFLENLQPQRTEKTTVFVPVHIFPTKSSPRGSLEAPPGSRVEQALELLGRQELQSVGQGLFDAQGICRVDVSCMARGLLLGKGFRV